mmetsp:Transcript_8532/g.12716  ORF Transcript_8532/g.12716 Transcript_8532/m.12716 type:complete len:274 (+) Transcript_8532:499-1320(+)
MRVISLAQDLGHLHPEGVDPRRKQRTSNRLIAMSSGHDGPPEQLHRNSHVRPSTLHGMSVPLAVVLATAAHCLYVHSSSSNSAGVGTRRSESESGAIAPVHAQQRIANRELLNYNAGVPVLDGVQQSSRTLLTDPQCRIGFQNNGKNFKDSCNEGTLRQLWRGRLCVGCSRCAFLSAPMQSNESVFVRQILCEAQSHKSFECSNSHEWTAKEVKSFRFDVLFAGGSAVRGAVHVHALVTAGRMKYALEIVESCGQSSTGGKHATADSDSIPLL